MPGLFQTKVKVRRPAQLKPVTLRDFSGGLNSVDSDELLSTKYSVTADNVVIGTDGSIGCRFGTALFANVGAVVTGNIVNMIYFADFLIVVMSTGQIAKVDSNGTATAIWNTAIAALLPGAPPGWGATTQVSFVPFKKELIIHNGVNKPITVSNVLVVTYLQDLATGSNVNTPIGFYGCTVSNYHVVAGITAAPTQIWISSAGTSGVWQGDPAPNDSISIDVGAYASLGAQDIRGVAGFRNYLLVFFRDSTLVITLGSYTGTPAVHTPIYNDTLTKFGLLNQRDIVYLENDILFAAPHGVASAKRNIFAGVIESKTLSEIVGPAYNQLSRALTPTQEVQNTFMVRDTVTSTLYVFLGNIALIYTFNDTLKVRGWGRGLGWNWTCGCESKQGRVFFGTGSKIYRLGNKIFAGEEVYADQVNEPNVTYANNLVVTAGQEVLDPATTLIWTALVNMTMPAAGTMAAFIASNPANWDQYLGVPITVDWELPWTDFREPERLKTLKTVKVGTSGTARFTFSVYVDGLYKDELGNIIHDPALSQDFVSSSQQGFGGSPAQYYGGGRNSQDPRIYKFPVRFKRMKVRIQASVREKLQINWITFMHTRGGMYR